MDDTASADNPASDCSEGCINPRIIQPYLSWEPSRLSMLLLLEEIQPLWELCLPIEADRLEAIRTDAASALPSQFDFDLSIRVSFPSQSF